MAFITGAARGQGRAHAVKLASEGADIIAVDLFDQIASVPYPMATPEDMAATVEDAGARIVDRRADVRDRAGLKSALQEGIAELGRVDIVIANAVCWLVSDAARYVTGVALPVDAGYVNKR